MPHTLSYCALIGKCALIRSNTVIRFWEIFSRASGKGDLVRHSSSAPYIGLDRRQQVDTIMLDFC